VEAYLYLALGGLVLLALERIRRALLALNRTLTHAAVANFKRELAEQGGSMQFTRLSDRARGGRHGEETTEPEAGEHQEAEPGSAA
jgi:hypothetical protein